MHLLFPSGAALEVAIAVTPAERARGLSNVPVPQAMLFDFGFPQRMRFMTTAKMLFALDVLFIDAHGVVVAVVRNANPPEFVYGPPCRYVLEAPAGFADAANVGPGDIVVSV